MRVRGGGACCSGYGAAPHSSPERSAQRRSGAPCSVSSQIRFFSGGCRYCRCAEDCRRGTRTPAEASRFPLRAGSTFDVMSRWWTLVGALAGLLAVSGGAHGQSLFCLWVGGQRLSAARAHGRTRAQFLLRLKCVVRARQCLEAA